jgi:hypothetical protein
VLLDLALMFDQLCVEVGAYRLYPRHLSVVETQSGLQQIEGGAHAHLGRCPTLAGQQYTRGEEQNGQPFHRIPRRFMCICTWAPVAAICMPPAEQPAFQ